MRKLVVVLLAPTLIALSASIHAADFIVGVGTHFGLDLGDPPRALDNAAAAGFTSFRDELHWSKIEARKGELALPAALERVDRAVGLAASKGMQPVLIFAYGNSLYAPGFPLSPEARAGFVRYVEFIASRYQGRVRYYELWNEWNQGMGGGKDTQGRAPERYVTLLKDVHAALKRIDPSAVLLAGAVEGSGSTRWIEEMFDAGAASYMDGLSIHPYMHHKGAVGTPENLHAWLSTLVVRLGDKPGGAGVPIYITEIGWPTNRGAKGVGDAQMADYFSRVLLSVRTIPSIKGIWWYNLEDYGGNRDADNGNFGLLRIDGTPKPAYRAATRIAGLVGAATQVERVRSDRDVWVVKLTDARGPVHALWNPLGRERDVALTFVASSATTIRAARIGAPADAAVAYRLDKGPGKITLTIGSTPTLIESDGAQLDLRSVTPLQP